MRSKTLAATAAALALMGCNEGSNPYAPDDVPALVAAAASQNTTQIKATVGFIANNPCNGDIIAGSGNLHIVVHQVFPNASGGFPGFGDHYLDKLNGKGTGAPSGLAYNVRADGAFTGINGVFRVNPANGAIVLQDDVRFVFDPIGAGSRGQKFTARLHTGTTIAFVSGNVNVHVQFDPGTCRN